MNRTTRIAAGLVGCLALLLAGCSNDQNVIYADRDPFMRIERVVPWFASPGTEVTIIGSNFTSSGSQITAEVGGRPAEVLEVTDTRVRLRIPSGTTESQIMLHQVGQSSASTQSVDFTLVRSPYNFNAFNLKLTGALASYKGLAETSNGHDTSTYNDRLYIQQGRVYTGEVKDGVCKEVSNGDTVWVCAHNSDDGLYYGSDKYEHSDSRIRFWAVIDPTRHVFSKVHYEANWSRTEQRTSVESYGEQEGQILELVDIPYAIGADGTMLTATMSGDAIRSHITLCNNVTLTTLKAPGDVATSYADLVRLLPFPAEASLELTLRRATP